MHPEITPGDPHLYQEPTKKPFSIKFIHSLPPSLPAAPCERKRKCFRSLFLNPYLAWREVWVMNKTAVIVVIADAPIVLVILVEQDFLLQFLPQRCQVG